jgi:hypothetical protein
MGPLSIYADVSGLFYLAVIALWNEHFHEGIKLNIHNLLPPFHSASPNEQSKYSQSSYGQPPDKDCHQILRHFRHYVRGIFVLFTFTREVFIEFP